MLNVLLFLPLLINRSDEQSMIRFCLFLSFCLLLFLPKTLFPQQIEAPLQWAEAWYGPNDLIVDGTMYLAENPKALGTPLFNTGEWFTNTSLYIKGEVFTGEALQYNLESDYFILRKTLPKGEIIFLQLNSLVIDSVRLEGHLFVNSKVFNEIDDDLGFVELIYDGKAMFFIKYSKKFLANYSEQKQHGEYSKQEQKRYLIEGNEVFHLNSKKSFLKHFEAIKSQIKKFLKSNSIKYKKASSEQLNQLLLFCYENQ